MSTLRVNTIQNASGGNAISVPGAAKAWVNFNGTGTVAIRAALNVSSITDVTTGRYLVNFTTAMADANYCTNVTGTRATGWAGNVDLTSTNPTASAVPVCTNNGSGNADSEHVCVSVFS